MNEKILPIIICSLLGILSFLVFTLQFIHRLITHEGALKGFIIPLSAAAFKNTRKRRKGKKPKKRV